MTLSILNGPVIAAGDSVSAAIDCTAGNITRITMPGDWTVGVLSFQASSDGILYNDLFHSDGREITFEVIPGTAVLVPADFAQAFAFLKFRSGSRQHPIPQQMLREFSIALDVREIATPGALNVKIIP
jgi:hypothetical protein